MTEKETRIVHTVAAVLYTVTSLTDDPYTLNVLHDAIGQMIANAKKEALHHANEKAKSSNAKEST